MTTSLNTLLRLPLTQPYNISAFGNYNGGETVTSIPNANVVDWVLVELRTGTASSTKVATKACFILKDGSVVGTDGVSAPQFTGLAAGNYYVVIRHRNHLAIMTASAIALSSSSSLYNFGSAMTQAYGTNPMRLVGSTYTMIPGDMNSNGNVKWSGSANDRAVLLAFIGTTTLNRIVSSYSANDINMDGSVKWSGSNNDRAVLLSLIGTTTLNKIYNSQVP